MKKLLIFTITAAMLLSLTACAQSAKPDVSLGCILPTPNVTGGEEFLRCARHFFAGILTYFKEKWCSAA